jgi:hypothetical protein
MMRLPLDITPEISVPFFGRKTGRILPVNSHFGQDFLHQAPVGKSGLQEVQSDEGRQKKPVGAVKISQSNRNENQRSGDGPDPVFHFHVFAS